jgi:hypothetical protein
MPWSIVSSAVVRNIRNAPDAPIASENAAASSGVGKSMTPTTSASPKA